MSATGGDDAQAGGTSDTRVSVTVDEEHRSSLGEVVEALRAHGMQVERVLEGLGMVVGSALDITDLRRVEGVSAIDTEITHQLPSPDEPIQ